jgi:hypothetical protein
MLAALLQVEQQPEAPQGNPLVARQALPAAAHSQEARLAGAAACRQLAGVALQALHPTGRCHLAAACSLGRRRAH